MEEKMKVPRSIKLLRTALTDNEKQFSVFLYSLIQCLIGAGLYFVFTFLPEKLFPNLFQSNELYRLIADVIMILLLLVIWVRVEKRTVDSIGIPSKEKLKYYLIGALIGSSAALSVWAIILLFKGATVENRMFSFNLPAVLFPSLVMMVSTFGHELVFRGNILGGVSGRNKMAIGLIVSVILEMLFYVFNGKITILVLVNVILVSLLMGIMYIRKGNVFLTAGVLGFWNIISKYIVGISSDDSAMFKTVFEPNKYLLNGGINNDMFGCLAVSIFCVIAMAMLYHTGKREAEEERKKQKNKNEKN